MTEKQYLKFRQDVKKKMDVIGLARNYRYQLNHLNADTAINLSHLSRILNGHVQPTDEQIERITSALNAADAASEKAG